MDTPNVAIIGAGVAGLACARALREAGAEVGIYDKGRGPGGRCSTRRSPFGLFDHGAQFFTVRDERFRARVEAWRDAGVAARWEGRHVEIEDGAAHPYDGDTRWIGAPAMNAFVRHEAEAVEAQFGLRLGRPARTGRTRRWALTGEGGQSAWEADWVVLAVPAEQVADLMPTAAQGGSDSLAAEARAARSEPTWTLMAAFEGGEAAPFDAASVRGHDLAWISREASKPGRAEGARWVAHASSAWSEAHLEDDEDAVVSALTDRLRDVVGEGAPLAHADVHRWRYAQVAETADEPFGLDADVGLATCGDWRIAPRVESAWVSGDALGRALAERL